MKDCLNCADNSSTTYSVCSPPVSTNCVFYQGASKECSEDTTFTICKGQNMSSVQETIFNKICELIGDINITSVEFPCSLQDGWKNQDPTILNLLVYLTQIACSQKADIASLSTSILDINPSVDVCLQCCGDECGSVKMLLSDALNKIVDCLCAVKAEAKAAYDLADKFANDISVLKTQINDPVNGLNKQIADLTTAQANTSCKLSGIQTALASAGIPIIYPC